MDITISSCRIHYELNGSGPLMVLLHGWGQHMGMMNFIAEHFQDHYQVLNIDLPGFGASEEPPQPWGIYEYCDALHALLEFHQLRNPILVAHSFGARIALRYAYVYPSEKMVLTGAAGIRAKRGFQYYSKVYLYKLRKKLKKNIAMGSSDFQNASTIMKGVLVRSVNEDMRMIIGDIATPTLLVWGELDEATPLWMGKYMEKNLVNGTLVVLAHDDHFAYFHQQQRFLAIMEHFL